MCLMCLNLRHMVILRGGAKVWSFLCFLRFKTTIFEFVVPVLILVPIFVAIRVFFVFSSFSSSSLSSKDFQNSGPRFLNSPYRNWPWYQFSLRSEYFSFKNIEMYIIRHAVWNLKFISPPAVNHNSKYLSILLSAVIYIWNSFYFLWYLFLKFLCVTYSCSFIL